MKKWIYLFMSSFMLMSYIAVSDPCENEESEDENCKWKRLPNYENSVIQVPIENEPLFMRPNSYESSFYEEMTR